MRSNSCNFDISPFEHASRRASRWEGVSSIRSVDPIDVILQMDTQNSFPLGVKCR